MSEEAGTDGSQAAVPAARGAAGVSVPLLERPQRRGAGLPRAAPVAVRAPPFGAFPG
ncbi:hypothetical protein [Pseudonocardia adelaidensis]|uniref:Uncharacterized protein n=1 Tax=Pseudonocardia adelaidensis TaxID=648754 RepID=A0ABP9P0Z7_9PSEU